MGIKVVKIPANLVKKGDVIVHEGEEYPVADVIQLRSSVQINHTKQGYFNLENMQAVEILCDIGTYKKLPKVTPVKAGMVVAGETLSYGVNFFYITRVEDYGSDVRLHHEKGYFDFVKSRVVYVVDPGPMSNSPTIEFPNQINPVFLPVENNMETLNIQNAIEAQRILLQKLEQMLDLQQLAPTEDGKIAIGNCNIRVDKATVIKAVRDEMKAAAGKSAELIKKL